jgi:hypothetical protein
MDNVKLAETILFSDRKLASLGIDPSSELGARLLGARIKLYWISQYWDVPVVVTSKTSSFREDEIGRMQARVVYSPVIVQKLARKVTVEEALNLRIKVMEEVVEAVRDRSFKPVKEAA